MRTYQSRGDTGWGEADTTSEGLTGQTLCWGRQVDDWVPPHCPEEETEVHGGDLPGDTPWKWKSLDSNPGLLTGKSDLHLPAVLTHPPQGVEQETRISWLEIREHSH